MRYKKGIKKIGKAIGKAYNQYQKSSVGKAASEYGSSYNWGGMPDSSSEEGYKWGMDVDTGSDSGYQWGIGFGESPSPKKRVKRRQKVRYRTRYVYRPKRRRRYYYR